ARTRREGMVDPIALVRAEGVALAVDVVLADARFAREAEPPEPFVGARAEVLDERVLGTFAGEQREGIAALGARDLDQAVLEVARRALVVARAPVLRELPRLRPH